MQGAPSQSSPVRTGEASSKLSANSLTTSPAADPMRLLLIEDDLQAAEYLVKGLRESG